MLLVIVIIALLAVAIIAVVLGCRKTKNHPDVKYAQLLNNENEFENDVETEEA